MQPIAEIGERMGLDSSHVIPYGRFKAKVPLEAIKTGGPRGALIVVTGITPTPAGEGKTTISVGLTQGLGRMGKRVVATLREPSLGPIFGIKGGGTGVRRFPGGARGRGEYPLHRRCSCRRVGPQPAGGHDGQRRPARPDSRLLSSRHHVAARPRNGRPLHEKHRHRHRRSDQRAAARNRL